MNPDTDQFLLNQMEELSDLTVTVRAELDQKVVTLSELLNLDVGTLLPFSRPTDENIDIYAEEVLIGWGEVLLTDGALTVRVANVRAATKIPRTSKSPAPTNSHSVTRMNGGSTFAPVSVTSRNVSI